MLGSMQVTGVILNTTKDHKGPQRTVVELQRTSRKSAQDSKGPEGHLIRHHCCIMIVIISRRAVIYVNNCV